MRFILFICLSMVVLSPSCKRGPEFRYTYYSDGKIQSKAVIVNGNLDGPSEEYYHSGKIRSRGLLRNGEQEGLLEEFYEGGGTKSKTFWKNGRQDGEAIFYFKNGVVKFRGRYDDGKNSEVARKFYETGILSEQRIYDSAGTLVYVCQYDSSGKRSHGVVVPQVSMPKDTIAFGSDAVIRIMFPYPMVGEIGIFAKGVDPFGRESMMKDLWCQSKDTAILLLPKPVPGHHTVLLEFGHVKINSKDTLTVAGYTFSCEIFVEGKAASL